MSVVFPFTPLHRGGAGEPLVLLHGIADSWRTWQLVLPELERSYDVLAPTLPGHAGGPPIEGAVDADGFADWAERTMDEAGFATARVAGNSLGGYLALRLAERGRAVSVVAFAPAGGWAPGDPTIADTLDANIRAHEAAKASAPQVGSIVSTAEGRQRALAGIVEDAEQIPPELATHLVIAARAATRCTRWSTTPAATAGRSTRPGSIARYGSHGAPRTACCPGPGRRSAIGATGCRTRTGSSWTAWGTRRSWTCHWSLRS